MAGAQMHGRSKDSARIAFMTGAGCRMQEQDAGCRSRPQEQDEGAAARCRSRMKAKQEQDAGCRSRMQDAGCRSRMQDAEAVLSLEFIHPT